VYSFDYNLQLSVIDSLKSIYRVESALPALVIEDTTYTGYKSVEDLEALLPERLKLTIASSTSATSTKVKQVK
jgi:hypothetical protein